mmetsp:Transcript_66363/g.154208  ORF Transcript_66363/g.154208 Transcript_66363/m.154208 type:complete len:315 (-) Transcript_66363:41-985(-)
MVVDDLESSGSSSEAAVSSPRRRGAKVAGVLLVVCAPCLWLLFHSHVAVPSEEDADFGEKLLVSREEAAEPTEAPLQVSLDDGNVCGADEELFAGLCYRKCSLLTGGQDAIRTSPWTCCEQSPCLGNQRLSVTLRVACSGYDVAGDGSCPHGPGSCLPDEELLLGVCYKKCSLLTKGDYVHRIAPATCCKESGLGCLDLRKDYTSEAFMVGGGRSRPGACHADEEMLLSVCYRKCSLLTSGKYPMRVAAATCCKAGSKLPRYIDGMWRLGCLDVTKDKTSLGFAVPGEAGHKASALENAHYPLLNLTENVVPHA